MSLVLEQTRADTSSPDVLARATGAVAAFAGALGILGNAAHVTPLLHPFGFGSPPSLLASLCLFALGCSTFAMLGSRTARLASVVIGLGLAGQGAWVTYRAIAFLHANHGLELGRGSVDLGSAVSFALQGATVAVFAVRSTTRAFVAIASTLTLCLALVSLLAYAVAVPSLRHYGAEMPFLLALAFAIHGGGMLAWAWRHDVHRGEAPMPTWSPLVAAISAGAIFVGFTIAVEGDAAILQLALVLGAAAKLGSGVHERLREQRNDLAARRAAKAAQTRAEETSAEALSQRRWLERILDLAPVPLTLIDPTSERVTFANEAAKALAAGPWDEDTTIRYADRLGRVLPEHDTPSSRVSRGERLDGTEIAAITPSGRHDLLVHGALLPPAQGQARVAVLALQDITRLRRAEEVTTRLGRILDDARTEVYVFDASTLRLCQANAGTLRDLGYRNSEIEDVSVLSILPDMTEETLGSLLEPLRTGELDQVVLETTHRRKDGSRYPVEARIQISRAENPPVFVALVENVTARKRTEAERARLLALEHRAREDADTGRERLEFVAEASRALAEPVDLEATLHVAAQAAIPRLGVFAIVHMTTEDGSLRRAAVASAEDAREAGDIVARDPPHLVEGSPIDRAITRGELVITSTLDDDDPAETLALSTDIARLAARDLRLAGALTIPLRARGRTLGALTIGEPPDACNWTSTEEMALASDYAARAALAIDDAQLHEDAKAALRARDEFLVVASHDLRLPVSLLRINLESMGRLVGKATPTRSSDTQITRLIDGSTRLSTKLSLVIEDIMDSSNVTGTRLPLSIENVDLASLVCTVVARFDADLAHANSRVLLSTPKVVDGDWDRFRLEQVVSSLLSNAIKHGAGRPIEISVEADDTTALVRIADQGPGIAQEHRANLFSLAARSASSRHYGGVGLGLYLVRRIVETLGGTVDVDTRPGAGSAFIVSLPRHGTRGALPSSQGSAA